MMPISGVVCIYLILQLVTSYLCCLSLGSTYVDVQCAYHQQSHLLLRWSAAAHLSTWHPSCSVDADLLVTTVLCRVHATKCRV